MSIRKKTKRFVSLRILKKRTELAKIRKKVNRDFSERNKTLRRQLLSARLEAKLKQEDVAYRFGWDQSFVSKLERGQRCASFVEVEKLAAIYGKQLGEFWVDIPKVRHHFGPVKK
jgi:ribosome-binding protein aMBF1 (putative translation factor)